MAQSLLKRLVFTASMFYAAQSFAEDQIIADVITYNYNENIVIAEGNVEIYAEDIQLFAERIVYFPEDDRIEVYGNIRVTFPSGEQLVSDWLVLDTKSREQIVGAAKLLLNNEFQIAANEIRESETQTLAYEVIASSCQVCVSRPTPLWQMRAKDALRDKPSQKIFFRDAYFDILGIPVAYIPTLRIPDSNATRMTGFLRPTIVNSSSYGTGFRFPFYWNISPYSDLLLSPYATSAGVINSEFQYRHQLIGGKFEIDGLVSVREDFLPSERYSVTGQIALNLPYEYALEAKYTHQSDYDFAKNYGFLNPPRNELVISKLNSQSAFSASVFEYRPSSEKVSNNTQTLVLPEISYQQYQLLDENVVWDSRFDLTAIRTRDEAWHARALSKNLFSVHEIYPIGIVATGTIGLTSKAYILDGDESFGDGFYTQVTPHLMLDFQMPFVKSTANGEHLLAPRMQFVTSQTYGDSDSEIPNLDARFVEFDYLSLFSENRFTGYDRIETGKRASVGLRYSYVSDDDWNIDAGLGQIYRISEDPNLALIDGLNKSVSDVTGFVNANYQDKYIVNARFSFDEDFNFSRRELGFEYKGDYFGISGDWVALSANPLEGFDDPRNAITLDSVLNFHPNWRLNSHWERDLQNKENIFARYGLTYGNECVQAKFGVELDYQDDSYEEYATRYEMSVTLMGLGTNEKSPWPAQNQCMRGY